MSQNEIVTIGQVSNFGDLIPPGKAFIGRCVKMDLKETKAEGKPVKPYLSIVFRVLAGDYEGLECTKTYFLNYKKTNGKLYIRGISELFDDMKAVGHAMPENTPITLGAADSNGRGNVTNGQELLKLVAQRLKPDVTPRISFQSIATPVQQQNPETQKWEDAYNDDGTKKMRTEYSIIGVPGAAVESAALGAAASAIAGGTNPDEGTTAVAPPQPASAAIEFV